MIEFKSTLQKIMQIENAFDVNSVSFKNLKIWPLVRLLIWQQLLNPDIFLKIHKKKIDNRIPILAFNKKWNSKFKDYLYTDLIFFTNLNHEHVEEFKGKIFFPFTDSLINIAKKHYSYLKLEAPIYNNAKYLQPRFESSIFINPILLGYQKDYEKSIKSFSELQKFIMDIAKIKVNEKVIKKQAWLINSWQKYYTELLIEIRPKVVFVVYYYYLATMALLRACRKLNIKTVDIQHGACGSYQAQYTHWTKVPGDGYDLLPDFFWCWGNTAKESIEKWLKPGSKNPKPIVGGNIKFINPLETKKAIKNERFERFYDQVKKSHKVILLTLGFHNSAESPLPDHLLKTMKISPENWMWLVRLHPDFRKKREIKKIKNILMKYGIFNFEMECASISPLNSLIKISDHNITNWSSTYYDALFFGVPTTIIHPSGLQYYEDDLEKGFLIYYADNSERLIETIKKGEVNRQRVGFSNYIIANKKLANNALRDIYKSAVKKIQKNSFIRSQRVNYNERGLLSARKQYSRHDDYKDIPYNFNYSANSIMT